MRGRSKAILLCHQFIVECVKAKQTVVARLVCGCSMANASTVVARLVCGCSMANASTVRSKLCKHREHQTETAIHWCLKDILQYMPTSSAQVQMGHCPHW
jgi:hypothetical protein